MKTIQLSEKSAFDMYEYAPKEIKTMLEESFGVEFFYKRPVGVWILSTTKTAHSVESYKNVIASPTGIGVVTAKTSFIVSLHQNVLLPFGADDIGDYDDVCYDKETYDNDAVTTAIIERHKNVKCKYNNEGTFDFIGAPAAEYCRSLSNEWNLPTLATAKVISSNIKAINDAIRIINGYIIPNCWLRTATIKDNNNSYLVDMGNGSVSYSTKNYDSSARAVSAFHFENYNFIF